MLKVEDVRGMNNLEIAKLLVTLFEEYDSLKDDELNMLEHNPLRDMWDEEMDEKYEDICDNITDKYNEIKTICDYVKGL